MKPETKERRENERVVFTMEENIDVTVSRLGKDETTPAALLSVSTGGLSFAVAKKEKKRIREGDKLIVSRIHLPGVHEAIARIEVEVKHIVFYKDLDRMAVGCEFENISDLVKKKIEEFINKYAELETP
jgi:c-di-GMP-binding flagellar brake protein YcgR